MGQLTEYLLSVTAAGIICGLIRRLLAGKGSPEALGKIIVGVFMALTVIGPIAHVRLSDFADLQISVSTDAEQAVTDGENAARNALAESISAGVESYILDRAAQFGAELTVRVELSHDPVPVPVKVYLQGNISPYGKNRLQAMIRDDLGIDKENQLWT